MVVHAIQPSDAITTMPAPPLTFLWLEITGQCNLACQHCYAGSSPQGHHGRMCATDWERVITQAAALGCRNIQFIGGEPTVHPDLVRLIRLAAALAMRIEVYSNLVSIKPAHWDAFQDCHVQLATSFYSMYDDVHEQITGGCYSFQKTVANIQLALQLSLPLRVGLIDMRDDQDIERTKRYLAGLGVQRMRVDRTREVGRGTNLVQVANPNDALCGACARGKAAVIPDGRVFPCVFSRHLTMGNVLHSPLQDIVSGVKIQTTRQDLAIFFARKFGKRHIDPGNPGNAGGPGRMPDTAGSIEVPCMPATEPYLKIQDLSSVLTMCDPFECDPNCEPGEFDTPHG